MASRGGSGDDRGWTAGTGNAKRCSGPRAPLLPLKKVRLFFFAGVVETQAKRLDYFAERHRIRDFPKPGFLLSEESGVEYLIHFTHSRMTFGGVLPENGLL